MYSLFLAQNHYESHLTVLRYWNRTYGKNLIPDPSGGVPPKHEVQWSKKIQIFRPHSIWAALFKIRLKFEKKYLKMKMMKVRSKTITANKPARWYVSKCMIKRPQQNKVAAARNSRRKYITISSLSRIVYPYRIQQKCNNILCIISNAFYSKHFHNFHFFSLSSFADINWAKPDQVNCSASRERRIARETSPGVCRRQTNKQIEQKRKFIRRVFWRLRCQPHLYHSPSVLVS